MNHRGEIENLLYAYQERLDAGDLVGMAALFEHATVGGVDEDAPMHGSADVLATFKKVLRVYENGTPRTTHTTLNPIIVVDEEAGTATSRSVYVVYQQTETFPLPMGRGDFRRGPTSSTCSEISRRINWSSSTRLPEIDNQEAEPTEHAFVMSSFGIARAGR
jgi:hypothetical protein